MLHSLNLYQKPAIGSDFVKRFDVYAYKHTISAMGWFDTAECELALPMAECETFLEQYIGNRVAFYGTNPSQPIWEGLISRIIYSTGTVQFTASLDQLANKVSVTYSQRNASPSVQTTAEVSNATSQSIYGIKQASIDGGANYTTLAVTTHKTTLRNQILATRSYPLVSASYSPGGRIGLLKIQCIGIYQTLDWETYTFASNIESFTPTNLFTQVFFNPAGSIDIDNGATFFAYSDTSLISTNAAYAYPVDNQTGQTYWQTIKSVCEAGDGTNRWIAGITGTDFNTRTRRFYYRQANTAVEYICSLRNGVGHIKNAYGRNVPLWEVVPDRSIRLTDVLVGWNLQGDDPRVAYLNKISYDAERQIVQWSSDDDIELTGSLQTDKMHRPYGQGFGTKFYIPNRSTAS